MLGPYLSVSAGALGACFGKTFDSCGVGLSREVYCSFEQRVGQPLASHVGANQEARRKPDIVVL
jgi:hypothetical protein